MAGRVVVAEAEDGAGSVVAGTALVVARVSVVEGWGWWGLLGAGELELAALTKLTRLPQPVRRQAQRMRASRAWRR